MFRVIVIFLSDDMAKIVLKSCETCNASTLLHTQLVTYGQLDNVNNATRPYYISRDIIFMITIHHPGGTKWKGRYGDVRPINAFQPLRFTKKGSFKKRMV